MNFQGAQVHIHLVAILAAEELVTLPLTVQLLMHGQAGEGEVGLVTVKVLLATGTGDPKECCSTAGDHFPRNPELLHLVELLKICGPQGVQRFVRIPEGVKSSSNSSTVLHTNPQFNGGFLNTNAITCFSLLT